MTTYKILILNFDGDLNRDIKELLRSYGYEVVQSVIDGNCLDDILKEMPHVILINCFKNSKAELDTCRIIGADERTKEIPIVAIFHASTVEDKQTFISLGIDDYINFPFENEDLVLRIRNKTKLVNIQKQLKLCKKALAENIDMIEKQKNELERNLSLASKIQEALIPKSLGNIPNCSFNWLYQPSGRVGGDIFDVFMLDEDHVGIYMIDVMGHGVAASMLAVTLSESLILDVDKGSPLKRKISTPPYYEIVPPVEVIKYLNKRFPFGKYEHYFTMFYMVLNVKTGVMKYVRGGHPVPLLVKDNGETIELDAYGTPIGFEFGEDYEEKTVYLDSGDHLIMYTDGLTEVKDAEGNSIGYDGIIDYVKTEEALFNGHFTMGLNKLVRDQLSLSDDISILEMCWIKFV